MILAYFLNGLDGLESVLCDMLSNDHLESLDSHILYLLFHDIH
jgi:hypothetical protein